MKTIVTSAILLVSTLTTMAQTTQNREAKPFKKIEISGSALVTFTQSDTISVQVTADAEEIDNISTTFNNDILIVKAKGSYKHPYKLNIKGNTLSQISLSGSSNFKTTNTLITDSLVIDASGASHLEADVKSKATDVIISGAAHAIINGNTENLYATTSGAASLKTYKLNAKAANVTTSGASTAKVFASDKINANATGSSTIKFKGDPKDVSAEASTASSISRVADENSKKAGEKTDSTTINFKNKQLVIIDKDDDEKKSSKKKDNDEDFHHWAGFSMGVNGWLSNGSTSMPKTQNYMSLNYGKSLNFQLNPFEKNIHIYKNYINLVTGLGFEWNQYEFSNRTKLNPDSSYTFGTIDSTNAFQYKKNRLKTTFVNIPLLLEFNTSSNPKKAFHLAFGVVGGYKLGSRTRQILEQNANDIKIIRKDDYNINPFRANAHVSLGYRKFTIYADYALNPLFEKGKGPELYPFTVGARLIAF